MKEKFRHLDLFSGIGGFAYAAQTIWGSDYEPVAFCEIDKFCQYELKRLWPNVPICKNIMELNNEWIDTNRKGNGLQGRGMAQTGQNDKPTWNCEIDLLTGGFPCQPFSVAGQQRGKDDDRYLWPEMLRVIKEVRPRWIIGENVAGFVKMALDECITDLEMAGYETQPYIIPACAVNAPHRRDRVWIIAQNPNYKRNNLRTPQESIGIGNQWHVGPRDAVGLYNKSFITDATWDTNWLEVATKLCRMDDGLPAKLDGFELTKSQHRKERLKALGNAIVPQVAMIIMQAIKDSIQWLTVS